MSLITAENIFKKYGEKVILAGVTVAVNAGERITLVGRNGIGKSTLLEIFAGHVTPDSGKVTRSREARINFVEQELTPYEGLTLWDFALEARPEITRVARSLHQLEHDLSERPHDEPLLAKYGDALAAFERLDGHEYEADVTATLSSLGFPQARWMETLNQFSGGERNRASLGRALLGGGNLLLLDEPTNHLDIASTEWLEKRLAASDKALVIVSHDRAFLTRLATKVWEVAFGKIDVYHNGFAKFLEERVTRREEIRKKYERQREFINKTEDFIRRNLAGQKTKQAQSRRKQLARLERLDSPRGEMSAPAISAQTGGRSFGHALAVRDLTIGYPSAVIAKNIEFDIYRGDRFGLVGSNGAGKSTLIKTLIGELPALAGHARFGGNCEIGYFDQKLSDLDESLNVIEQIWLEDPLVDQGTVRSYLARYGFFGDDVMKSVAALSGGEKTKLSLAILMYHPVNFLILDEPTNHLDIESREALEEALRQYDGSYIVVSHDRYFLEQVTDKTLVMDGPTVEFVPGPYSYYQRKRSEQATQTAQATSASRTRSDDAPTRENKKAAQSMSRQRAQLEKELSALANKIAQDEALLAECDEELRGRVSKDDWEALSEVSLRKNEIERRLLERYQEVENTRVGIENLENDNSASVK